MVLQHLTGFKDWRRASSIVFFCGLRITTAFTYTIDTTYYKTFHPYKFIFISILDLSFDSILKGSYLIHGAFLESMLLYLRFRGLAAATADGQLRIVPTVCPSAQVVGWISGYVLAYRHQTSHQSDVFS